MDIENLHSAETEAKKKKNIDIKIKEEWIKNARNGYQKSANLSAYLLKELYNENTFVEAAEEDAIQFQLVNKQTKRKEINIRKSKMFLEIQSISNKKYPNETNATATTTTTATTSTQFQSLSLRLSTIDTIQYQFLEDTKFQQNNIDENGEDTLIEYDDADKQQFNNPKPDTNTITTSIDNCLELMKHILKDDDYNTTNNRTHNKEEEEEEEDDNLKKEMKQLEETEHILNQCLNDTNLEYELSLLLNNLDDDDDDVLEDDDVLADDDDDSSTDYNEDDYMDGNSTDSNEDDYIDIANDDTNSNNENDDDDNNNHPLNSTTTTDEDIVFVGVEKSKSINDNTTTNKVRNNAIDVTNNNHNQLNNTNRTTTIVSLPPLPLSSSSSLTLWNDRDLSYYHLNAIKHASLAMVQNCMYELELLRSLSLLSKSQQSQQSQSQQSPQSQQQQQQSQQQQKQPQSQPQQPQNLQKTNQQLKHLTMGTLSDLEKSLMYWKRSGMMNIIMTTATTTTTTTAAAGAWYDSLELLKELYRARFVRHELVSSLCFTTNNNDNNNDDNDDNDNDNDNDCNGEIIIERRKQIVILCEKAIHKFSNDAIMDTTTTNSITTSTTKHDTLEDVGRQSSSRHFWISERISILKKLKEMILEVSSSSSLSLLLSTYKTTNDHSINYTEQQQQQQQSITNPILVVQANPTLSPNLQPPSLRTTERGPMFTGLISEDALNLLATFREQMMESFERTKTIVSSEMVRGKEELARHDLPEALHRYFALVAAADNNNRSHNDDDNNNNNNNNHHFQQQ